MKKAILFILVFFSINVAYANNAWNGNFTYHGKKYDATTTGGIKQTINVNGSQVTIKVDPKHIDSRLHLASIHHSAGRWKIAAPLWRDVLDIDSDNDVARQRLSHCEMQITTVSK